jgi:hypothetical protein
MQFVLVPNDMLEVIALPERLTRSVQESAGPDRRDGFEYPNDSAQSRGAACCALQEDDAMDVVRHDCEFIQGNRWEPH